MNEFMDIVLTENTIGIKRVFILPDFTRISPGDVVAEEVKDGERSYRVITSCTFREDDDALNFIMKLCEPVKAYKIYRAEVMNYKNYKNEQEGKTDE